MSERLTRVACVLPLFLITAKKRQKLYRKDDFL
nr:MAG TPA: hypothetical protein [Caudoviricetes sp.]